MGMFVALPIYVFTVYGPCTMVVKWKRVMEEATTAGNYDVLVVVAGFYVFFGNRDAVVTTVPRMREAKR